MTTYKVSELDGALLDMAVAEAEGLNPVLIDGQAMIPAREEEDFPGEMLPWPASSDWSYGGPIIERERIVLFTGDIEDGGPVPDWVAFVGGASIAAYRGQGSFCRTFEGRGPSPLIAAMRAFVVSKFGETIDLYV